jgi:cytochrome c-type biogenesis protein CcmF
VHLGVILLLTGVTGSQALKLESGPAVLSEGETLALGGYMLTLQGLDVTRDTNRVKLQAAFLLEQEGRPRDTLAPIRERLPNRKEAWSRVAVRSTLVSDVYVSLLDVSEEERRVLIAAQVYPLVSWLWLGGVLMALGALPALLGSDRRAQA